MPCSNNCPGCTCETGDFSPTPATVSLKDLRSLARSSDEHNRRVESFNEAVSRAVKDREHVVHLDFHQYGFDWEDVKFIQDAEFPISRNSACLWWEVSLKEVY